MQNNIDAYDHSKQSKRLMFIDVMRAYAILMMIEGHVVDSLIDPIYRDHSNWLFALWDYMRGVTAPVFFFSAGTIFSYLLLRKNLPIMQNERFFKGMKRVLSLTLIGYALKFNFDIIFSSREFSFEYYKYAFAVDALHCIAFGLGMILLSYFINRISKIPIWLIYLAFAFLPFYFFADVAENSFSNLPIPIASYLTKIYGSNFPVIPWTGFVMWGALLGYFLSKKVNIAFNNIFAISMLCIGLYLHFYSGSMLDFLFRLFNDYHFDYLNHHNFLFYHLGNVLVVLGILALISNFFKIPPLLAACGKNTMMIYVVHIFLIYGTGVNFGIAHYFGKSLTPIQVVIAAIVAEIFFISLVYYWEKYKPKLQDRFPKYFPKKKVI